MSVSLCLTIFAALFLVQAAAHTHDELSQQYPYNVQPDSEDRYTMFYNYDADIGILKIALLVQTTGWVGLGVSPNGQMPGSDVVMGWVDSNGTGFLQDRFAFARTVPRLDANQDWELKESSEEGGYTMLQFERRLDTCDEDDLPINFGDTTYLIYCFHSEDPVNNEQFLQHEVQGAMRINLFGQPQNVNNVPDDTPFFEIRLENVSIPATETTYFCTLIELPKIFRNKTHYILKYAPVITPTSLPHVHHMQVFLCEGMNLTGHAHIGINQHCDGIAREISPCRASTVFSGWAIGATDYTLPEGVAFPIGGEDVIHTHVLFEMHYDNPGEVDGLIDSSGVRYFYTEEPPEIRAGIVPIGYNVIGHMIIPPNVERYTVTAYCPLNCTNAFFPEGGITVYASLLHTHTVGSQVTLRHIRDGVELDPIDLNRNYDFNYQQINYIPRVQIMPGDEMILECVYDSSNRNVTTFGGEGSRDEMCFVYLHYFPATGMSYCVSVTNPNEYDGWVNTHLPSDQQHAVYTAAANNISVVRPIFDSFNWTEERYRGYERIGTTGQQSYYCLSSSTGYGVIDQNSQPIAVERPLEQSDNCVNTVDTSGSPTPTPVPTNAVDTSVSPTPTNTVDDTSGSATLYGSVITMMLCWMMAAFI